MATKLQENLQVPLLLELATLHCADEIIIEKGGDHDFIFKIIEGLYDDVPAEYKSKKVSGGTPKFRNDLLFAKKQLESTDEIVVRPKQRWRITEKGLLRLRKCVHQILSGADDTRVIELMSQRIDGKDAFIFAFQGVQEDGHSVVLYDCQSYVQLFVESIGRLSPEIFAQWLVLSYELVRDLIVEYHIHPFVEHNFPLTTVGHAM